MARLQALRPDKDEPCSGTEGDTWAGARSPPCPPGCCSPGLRATELGPQPHGASCRGGQGAPLRATSPQAQIHLTTGHCPSGPPGASGLPRPPEGPSSSGLLVSCSVGLRCGARD